MRLVSAMTGGVCAAAILMTTAVVHASTIDLYDCGDVGADLVLEIRLSAQQGKASLKSANGLTSLKPDGKGAWVDSEQVIQFYPEADGPRLFMGSEQFSCATKSADGPGPDTNVQTAAVKPVEPVEQPSAAPKSEEMAKEPEPEKADSASVEVAVAKPEPQMGLSLGGRVRGGPGTKFDQTDSLTEGEPVEIVANTGVRLDGFDWFEIRYGEGETGFQWGGIMCSKGEKVGGIYRAC